ncbi:MAG: hypothetical protein JNM90_24545, partial [Burkholderiales bacterium]|nr:hypothetical protein [Burkholderiales bacterium]
HLAPPDVAIVRVRRARLDGARALAAGTGPAAAHQAAAFRVRGGGALAPSTQDFDAVMRARFGSTTGRIE